MSETARTTISISKDVYDRALAHAEPDKRNFSNLCEVALEEYLKVREPAADEEIAQAVVEAKAAKVDIPNVLAAAVRRKEKSAA